MRPFPRLLRPALAALVVSGSFLVATRGAAPVHPEALPALSLLILLATLLSLPRPGDSRGLILVAGAAAASLWGSGAGGAVVAGGALLGVLPHRHGRKAAGLDFATWSSHGEEILRLTASALAAGAVLDFVDRPATAFALSAATAAGLALALSRPPLLDTVLRGAVELVAWSAGLALGWVLGEAGWSAGLPLVLVFGLLAGEAFRQRTAREAAEDRAASLSDLSRAGERVVADGDRLDRIADQIRSECRRVLPFDWFELEIPGERTWHAGPDGRLEPGEARPEPLPAPLPGIHRRKGWRTLDRELVVDTLTVGRLRLWCDPRRLRRFKVQLLDPLLPQMAASLHRAHLDRRARRDGLTDLPQRHVLDLRLDEAFAASREGGGPVAVVLCDIDHFKAINDTWGHAAGDVALVQLAEILEAHRREGDLCCRWGGEEFALLLENTDGEHALQIAERLREAVEATEVAAEGQTLTMTLSSGVAAFPELFATSGQELINLADAALYEAKRQGRNRCLLYRGKGKYLDARGTTVLGEDLGPRAEAPRFFA